MLGILRVGVPVASEVARVLDADLDVIVARKLRAPGSPELAIGAVTASGGRFLNDDLIEELGVTDRYLEKVTEQERPEAHRHEERFRGDRPAQPIEGRTVIIVDDGLATGATMRAAVRSVRSMHPKRLVIAVPVGSSRRAIHFARRRMKSSVFMSRRPKLDFCDTHLHPGTRR